MFTKNDFRNFADDFLAKCPVPGANWSEDGNSLHLPKQNQDGFDILVEFEAHTNEITINTYTGYHTHLYIDMKKEIEDQLGPVFGLVRDMLSSKMRIVEYRNATMPVKWQLQSYINDEWVTESTMVLLTLSIFGKKTKRVYTNDTLPVND